MNYCQNGIYNQNTVDSTVLPSINDLYEEQPTPTNTAPDRTPVTMVTCDLQAIRSAQSSMVVQNLLVTFLVLSMFIVTKSYYNHMRKQLAKCTVFVIGAGPTGLTSALLASQNPHVSQIIIYEEMTKADLIQRAHQVEFNRKSRDFLSCLGVDFDSLEGCLENNIFHTRVGVFLEYLMDMLSWGPVPITFRIGMKFSRDKIVEIENHPGRKVVIASDGSSGHSARLLGLSDEFLHRSCHAFGAVASMDRSELNSVPLAERRIHGISFDLSAYGIDLGNMEVSSGTFQFENVWQYKAQIYEYSLAKTRVYACQAYEMMRNIFIKCFNACKWSSEKELNETWALRHLKFSPRLFDIKLFQRLETVAFFQESDMFVFVEGEAAMCCNFHTGLDVNMAISNISALPNTLELAACALTEVEIMNTMLIKSQHSETIARQYLRTGLKQDIFSHYY